MDGLGAGNASRRSTTTLAQVAKLAGVSVGTASKALNGRGSLRPETRERVEEAARTLKFSPNMQATSLHAGRTGTVGLITDDLVGRFSLPILAGAEDALGSGNLSVLLCDSRGDSIRERHHLRVLLGRRIDGLIVVGDSTDPRPSIGRDFPVPVIYAYRPSLDPHDMSVTTDDQASGRLAVDHLLSQGRSRILYIGGDPSFGAAAQRAQGGAAALRDAGLSYVAAPMFGAWSEEWGRAAIKATIGRAVKFDAVACGSDQIARGALDALSDAGRQVPSEVAVVGHDNWDVVAEHSRPPLTSIDMNLERIGAQAARLLLDTWDAPPLGRIDVVDGRLVVRGSSV